MVTCPRLGAWEKGNPSLCVATMIKADSWADPRSRIRAGKCSCSVISRLAFSALHVVLEPSDSLVTQLAQTVCLCSRKQRVCPLCQCLETFP